VTFYSELLHAHELAHQWWGNIVTAETYRDGWLQEALANYTALLSLERKKGARGLETTLGEYRDELMGQLQGAGGRIEAVGPITWGLRLRAEGGVDPWRVIIYDKGSWILHMLRRRCGDERFYALLGELRKRYSYRTITTEQFRDLASAFLPKGDPDPTLEVFFDAWVYSTGIPQFTLTSKVKGKAPAVELAVTLSQTGVGDDFSADVPVEIRLPGQAKPVVKWMRTGPEPAVLSVKLKAAPLKVELAPGSAVLMTGR
jgi:aminopeptidase N